MTQHTNDIQLGRLNSLTVTKQVDFGFYLDGGPVHGEILLPNGEIHPDIDVRLGDDLTVFVYLDQEERLIATTRQVLAQVGDFAYLEVAWVNNYGAFLDWGLMKDLFVPFREQKMKMQKGQRYIVHVHLDEESYRIMASAKVDRYLRNDELADGQGDLCTGDEVEALIWQKTDLGFKAIINNRYGALLYDDQVFRQLRTGDRVRAYVSQIRPDGKVDIMLQRPGMEAVTDFSETLLRHIQMNGGRSELNDKTPAEEVYALFGVSKKVFKKAIGDLYKRRLIEITHAGLKLV